MTVPADDLADWLRLAAVPGVGTQGQRALLAAFGLPGHIFAAGRGALAAVVGGAAADAVLAAPAHEDIERALAWAGEAGNHILTLADAAYPRQLFDIADPPVLLYVKGDPALLSRPGIALVGARSATAAGEANAGAFARALAEQGLVVVSGLALGIDAAAHRGALAAGTEAAGTVAVIGTGIDRIYPARNAALAREIAAAGAVVSEFPLGTPPLQHNFPRRNRLISGLARAVLVVEATVDSGSLITARLAAEQGREVCAIPGSIHAPQARGCHKLIKQGAKLVETAEDVLEELGLDNRPTHKTDSPTTTTRSDDPNSAHILAALGYDPCPLDTLIQRCGLTAEALSVILLRLELDGQVAALPGERYQRLPGS